jgi:hypothetical protein
MPKGAATKKKGYAALSTDGADDKPQTNSAHTLSGHNAAGEAHSHWSGLSPEEARDFVGCPSDRAVFPEYDAGFFTFWSYQWLTPLMKLGNRCHLQDSDVWAIHPKEACYTTGPPMREKWQHEQRAATYDYTQCQSLHVHVVPPRLIRDLGFRFQISESPPFAWQRFGSCSSSVPATS